jgi:hypothetical protein
MQNKKEKKKLWFNIKFQKYFTIPLKIKIFCSNQKRNIFYIILYFFENYIESFYMYYKLTRVLIVLEMYGWG